LWFPDLNRAIECNGTYWHSLKKAVVRDKIKRQLCKQKDIDLLVITDEEWNDDIGKCKAKLISFIKTEVGKDSLCNILRKRIKELQIA
jgi:hypothetical protein